MYYCIFYQKYLDLASKKRLSKTFLKNLASSKLLKGLNVSDQCLVDAKQA